MKQILFLMIVISLFSCRLEEGKPSKLSIKEQLAEFEANIPEDRHFFQEGDTIVFEGKLDTLDVILEIIKLNRKYIYSRLIHKSVGVTIPIEGRQDTNGLIHLYEFLLNSVVGIWSGYVVEDKFYGYWRPDTTKQKGYLLDFSLKVSEKEFETHLKKNKDITGIYYNKEYSSRIYYDFLSIIPSKEEIDNYNLLFKRSDEKTEYQDIKLIDDKMLYRDTIENEEYLIPEECSLLFLNEKIISRSKIKSYKKGTERVRRYKSGKEYHKWMNLDTKFPKILGKRYDIKYYL